MVQIGSRILEYRKKLNMSQEEFANKIGVSRQAVSKWELDKAYPDLDKLMDICEMFGLSLDELVNGKEQAETEDINIKDDSLETEGQMTDGSDEEKTDESADFDDTDGQIVDRRKRIRGRKIRLYTSMYITAACAVFCIVVSSVIIFQQARNRERAVTMNIEKVYSQYTLADVRYLNNELDDKRRVMWLDTKGIRAGDSITGYIDEDGELAYVDHDMSTLLIPCMLALIFIIVCILIRIELSKLYSRELEKVISDKQEKA